jgi:hypothetical protein
MMNDSVIVILPDFWGARHSLAARFQESGG